MKENSIEEDIEYIKEVIALAGLLPNGEVTVQKKETKAITNILSDYKRVLKENERYQKSDYEAICLENNELSETIDRIQSEYNDLLKENEELKKSKITYENVRDIQEKNKNIVDKNYISKQKVKDKIEEIQGDKTSKYYDMFLEERDLEYTIKILQELLEESEK